MNARTYSLATFHRDDLASLPGAQSISFHAQEAWSFMLIMAAADEAVIWLSEHLGLTLDFEEGHLVTWSPGVAQ